MKNLGFRIRTLGSIESESFGAKQALRGFLKYSKSKPVICKTTGKWYISAKRAAMDCGVSRVSVQKCCSGERKSCKGMKWEYSPKTETFIK